MQTSIAFISTIYFEMLLPRAWYDPLKELVKTEARTICSVQKRIKREAKKKKRDKSSEKLPTSTRGVLSSVLLQWWWHLVISLGSRNTVELCQVLQGFIIPMTNLPKCRHFPWSHSAPVLAVIQEVQQLGVIRIIVEEQEWDRECRPNPLQLDQRHDLKQLVQCPNPAWQCNHSRSVSSAAPHSSIHQSVLPCREEPEIQLSS